jgi:hypothetical protein
VSLIRTFQEAPFREKCACAMTLILTIAGAYYFSKVVAVSAALGETAPPDMHLVVFYIVMIVIASIVVTSVIAGSDGKEANAPPDERERLIQHKAGNWAGYVLAVPAVAALMHYSVNGDGHLLFHLVFLSLLASQIADYVFQIILFRRGT